MKLSAIKLLLIVSAAFFGQLAGARFYDCEKTPQARFCGQLLQDKLRIGYAVLIGPPDTGFRFRGLLQFTEQRIEPDLSVTPAAIIFLVVGTILCCIIAGYQKSCCSRSSGRSESDHVGQAQTQAEKKNQYAKQQVDALPRLKPSVVVQELSSKHLQQQPNNTSGNLQIAASASRKGSSHFSSKHWHVRSVDQFQEIQSTKIMQDQYDQQQVKSEDQHQLKGQASLVSNYVQRAPTTTHTSQKNQEVQQGALAVQDNGVQVHVDIVVQNVHDGPSSVQSRPAQQVVISIPISPRASFQMQGINPVNQPTQDTLEQANVDNQGTSDEVAESGNSTTCAHKDKTSGTSGHKHHSTTGECGSQKHTYEATWEDTCCVICLEDWDEGGEVVRLACGHALHRSCAIKWAEKQKTGREVCPTCKLPMFPQYGE